MVKIKVFENSDKVNQELATIESNRRALQAIYDALKALGAEEIAVPDLQEVIQMGGGAPSVKELVFRGKSLKTTDGFRINAQAIELPQKALKEIMRMAQDAERLTIKYSRFTIGSDTVRPIQGIEKEIRSLHTVYATEETAAIIKDVETICDLINGVAERMGVNHIDSYNPLRDVELWFANTVDFNSRKRKFLPDVPRIVGHIERDRKG